MNKTNRTKQVVSSLNIIDDTLFQKMAEDIGFCEELLSTVLGQKVLVEKVIPQNSKKICKVVQWYWMHCVLWKAARDIM